MMATKLTATAAAITLLLTGCTAGSNTIETIGTVDDSVQSVVMPSLSVPAVNLDAGFAALEPGAANNISNTAATYSLGSVQQLRRVNIALGDQVRTGQILATVDDRPLQANLQAAKADAQLAGTQVDVLTAAISDTYTKSSDIAEAKTEVNTAIAKISKTKAELKRNKAKLITTRAGLVTKLAETEKLLANYPPAPVPGVPTKAALRAAIVKLKKAITGIDAALTKITKAAPQLTSGLAKARAGLVKLNSAGVLVSEVRDQLRGLRKLAEILATTAEVPVSLAQTQLQLTNITAPTDGVVVQLAAGGDWLAPGATLVKLRPNANPQATTWLSPGQLAKVCLGDQAAITGDWMPTGQSAAATLTQIAASADFPPSATTTDETHLTRAVEVKLTATSALPPGVPVEINITGCRRAPGQTEQGR